MDRYRRSKTKTVNAAIDIGTNTVLLLVANVDTGAVQVLHEEQRIPRLGAGVDESGNLSEAALQRVINALQEYQQMIKKKYPATEQIFVTATSAVRDAQNKEAFLSRVGDRTGLEVTVLSGMEEAQYTFAGAMSVLKEEGPEKEHVIIDIGGGSTEIAKGRNSIRDRYSFDMGCVRFTERFLKNDPAREDEIALCREAIMKILDEYSFNFVDESQLIGVAGTVTSLAYIDKKLDSYNSKLLSGYVLSQKSISSYINEFKQYSSEELKSQYPEVLKGRADIFLAGLLILEGFMNKYSFQELITSTGGIRHGSILINS